MVITVANLQYRVPEIRPQVEGASLRSLLVALDGTASGETATELGIKWAERTRAFVTGLAVLDEPDIRRGEPVPLGGGYYKKERDKEVLNFERWRVEECLRSFERRCSEAGVPCAVINDTGMPYERISIEARRYDVILAARKSRFRFGGARDYTLRDLLRSTARPLVVVPEELKRGNGALVAYDGSMESDRALQSLLFCGLHFGEQITVLCMDSDLRNAALYADSAVDYLRYHGLDASPLPRVAPDNAAQEILSAASGANLLVLGGRYHSKVRELIKASATASIVDDSPVPLLLCS